jgi:hypothetical protein
MYALTERHVNPSPNAVKDPEARISLPVAVRSANERVFAERKATYLPTF